MDGITTVIQNGWKMAGVSPTPELQYHKETKLLMAYGEPEKLSTINDVLKVLKPKEVYSPFARPKQATERVATPLNQANSASAPKTSSEESGK